MSQPLNDHLALLCIGAEQMRARGIKGLAHEHTAPSAQSVIWTKILVILTPGALANI